MFFFCMFFYCHKSEDKSMRVFPLDQYYLVDQDPDLNTQLASTKTLISWGCASSRCFRHKSSGPETSSSLKKGCTKQHRQDSLRSSAVSDNGKNHVPDSNDETVARKFVLKSSLKKSSDATVVSVRNTDVDEGLRGKSSCDSSHKERRKVQWTDTCGSELAEVKEFEPSEINASDDEIGTGKRRCLCNIM